MHRNITKKVLMVMSGMIIGKFLSFAWRGILSNGMTSGGFSDFITFFICINIASQIAFTPIHELVAKEPIYKYQSRSVIAYFLFLYGPACILAIAISCGMMISFSYIYGRVELLSLLMWAALLPILSGALTFLIAMLRSVGDHLSRTLFYLIGVNLFFVVILLFSDNDASDAKVSSYVLSYLISAILCLIFFKIRFPFNKRVSSPLYAKKTCDHIRFILPLLFVQVLDATSGWVDSIVVGAWLYDEMGIYSNVSFLAKVVLMGNSALYFVIVPVFSRLLEANETHVLTSEYKKRTHQLALIVTPAALFLLTYGHELLDIIFAIDDPSMAFSLQILVTGYWVSTLLGPILALTLANGKTKEIFLATFVFISFNILFSILLIPTFGVVGAAGAASAGYFVSLFYLVWRQVDSIDILSLRVIPYVAFVSIISYGFSWIIDSVFTNEMMQLMFGCVVTVLISAIGYFAILSDSHERLLIRGIFYACRKR